MSLACVWVLWADNPTRQRPYTLTGMFEMRQAYRAALVQNTDQRLDEDFGFRSLGSPPGGSVFVRCLPSGVDPVFAFTGKR